MQTLPRAWNVNTCAFVKARGHSQRELWFHSVVFKCVLFCSLECFKKSQVEKCPSDFWVLVEEVPCFGEVSSTCWGRTGSVPFHDHAGYSAEPSILTSLAGCGLSCLCISPGHSAHALAWWAPLPVQLVPAWSLPFSSPP